MFFFLSNSFLALHHWMALLIPPFGFCLNLTLLWLILRKTPKEMWVHSRVLLQTCVLDLLLLSVLAMGGCAMAISRPVDGAFGAILVFLDGYLVGMFKRLVGDGPAELTVLFHLWYGIFSFDVFGISVQFFYRYLILNRGKSVNFRQYLLLLLPSLLVSVAMQIFLNFYLNPAAQDEAGWFSQYVDMDQQKHYILLTMKDSTNSSSTITMLGVIYTFLFYGTLLALIIFCGRQMVRFVGAHAMNERLKELNRQLTRSLVLLAIFPMALNSVIFVVLLLQIFSPSNVELIFVCEMLASLLMNFLPIINPLTTIWTFRPYRETIILILRRPFRKAQIAPIGNGM